MLSKKHKGEEKKNQLGLKGHGSAGWFVILDKGTRADFIGKVTLTTAE